MEIPEILYEESNIPWCYLWETLIWEFQDANACYARIHFDFFATLSHSCNDFDLHGATTHWVSMAGGQLNTIAGINLASWISLCI